MSTSTGTFNAAVFMGPGKFEYKEVPVRPLEDGEARIKVEACAICGTDVRIYKMGQKNVVPPRITGHEICGVVTEVTPGADVPPVGTRVIVLTPVGCGTCKFCKKKMPNLCPEINPLGYGYDGGFAEEMIIPAEAMVQQPLIPVPDGVSPEQACLAEPLSCCINGQHFLDIESDDVVLIYGAGPIGLMHVALAKARNARKAILADVNPDRLKEAEGFGADLLVNSAETDLKALVDKETDGKGVDVIVTAAPVKQILVSSLDLAGVRARISWFASVPKDDPAITIDPNIIHYKEISVFGVFASNRAQYAEALDLIASGKVDIDKFIYKTFPLSQIDEAFRTAMTGEGLKVIVKPEG